MLMEGPRNVEVRNYKMKLGIYDGSQILRLESTSPRHREMARQHIVVYRLEHHRHRRCRRRIL